VLAGDPGDLLRELRAREPNIAHKVLAYWEETGLLKALITQNIDDLHFRAGTRDPIEYHGNSRMLVCTETGTRLEATPERLAHLPPTTDDGALLKPDFVFSGRGYPARLPPERVMPR
jgi:NAD-dependent deacetylase